MKNYILILTTIFAITACGPAKTVTDNAMPIEKLATEYKQSKAATKAKYSGKMLIVKAWVGSAPIMPKGRADIGIMSLAQKGSDMSFILSCHFSDADKAGFAMITADSTVIVAGIFEDEMSLALKSCKVVTE